MFKPFFIHRNHAPGKMRNSHPRGFTALVSPTNDPRKVAMAVTFCSPKDEFSKKEGRKQANDLNKTEIINARAVAGLLASCATLCHLDTREQDFHYVYKHML